MSQSEERLRKARATVAFAMLIGNEELEKCALAAYTHLTNQQGWTTTRDFRKEA